MSPGGKVARVIDDELAAMAVAVIHDNRYLTLGTVEPDGLPRLSPVYFTQDGYRDFYWVSSPTARHSANIARQPSASAVIFDSSVPVGEASAVYLTGTAHPVSGEQLAQECSRAFRSVHPGAHAFTPSELSGDASLRLFRLRADRHEVHVRGRHPRYGTGVDTRREVPLGAVREHAVHRST